MTYQRDCLAIAAHAATGADAMADVITFVVASIREPFPRMRNIMRDIRQRGAASGFLWGFKRVSFEHVQEHKQRYFDCWRAMVDRGEASAETVTHMFTGVPGLGIVKAAFVAQMLGYNVACFDSRNMQALGFGHGDRPWRTDGRKISLAKVTRYVAATRETGGAAYWWDQWCTSHPWAKLGNDVSLTHAQIIIGARII